METNKTLYALSKPFTTTLECALAGGAAGIVVDFIFYPIEAFKTYLQANRTKVKSIDRFRKGRLYAGFSCPFIVSFPTSSAFFLIYELTSSKLLGYCKLTGNSRWL